MARGRAEIDVSTVTTSEDLHDLFAARLALPGYYGRNWDAFWDCICDNSQSVMPAVLCIRGWETLLERLPEDAQILRRILVDLLPSARTDVEVEWLPNKPLPPPPASGE